MWRFVTDCDCLWRPVTVCDALWLLVTVCDCLWRSVSACDGMWLYVTVCDCLWPSVTACDRMWMYVNVCDCIWWSVMFFFSHCVGWWLFGTHLMLHLKVSVVVVWRLSKSFQIFYLHCTFSYILLIVIKYIGHGIAQCKSDWQECSFSPEYLSILCLLWWPRTVGLIWFSNISK